MRYPIGRISKLLGLSTETIRTYERKGIVHPQKNENGYRTFHVLDIGTLLRCRSYSCFGLSLSEAADAINCNSVAETHALLVKQEKWLKKQTDYNLRMLNRLNDLNEVMSTCEREINRLSVVQHPGMFRVDYRHNDELLSGDAREDCWRGGRPCAVFLRQPEISAGIQRAEQDYFCGYGILEEDARYCGVCMDELVECFPASPAVHTILKVVGEDSVPIHMLTPLLDFARENRLVPTADAFTRMVVTIKRK
ncbi:MAG: MerR family transcriptional regulator [Christensenellales bacterium]